LSIKPRTRDYWRECLAALKKSWAGLNETEVRKITQADCKKWATGYGGMSILKPAKSLFVATPTLAQRIGNGDKSDRDQSKHE
jgi:hypothetical protein